MRLDSAQTKLLLIVIAVLVAGASVWYPSVRDIGKLRAEIDSVEQQLLGTRGQASALTQLAVEVQAMRDELHSTSKIVPHADELAEVLRSLSVEIESLQLGEQAIITKPTVESPNYVSMPVEITFRGDSRAAVAFVNRIEQLPRLMRVNGLRMDGGRDARRVEAAVELEAFFIRPTMEGPK